MKKLSVFIFAFCMMFMVANQTQAVSIDLPGAEVEFVYTQDTASRGSTYLTVENLSTDEWLTSIKFNLPDNFGGILGIWHPVDTLNNWGLFSELDTENIPGYSRTVGFRLMPGSYGLPPGETGEFRIQYICAGLSESSFLNVFHDIDGNGIAENMLVTHGPGPIPTPNGPALMYLFTGLFSLIPVKRHLMK